MTLKEVIKQLQALPEDEAMDILQAVALELGYWPRILNVIGLYILKPDDPRPEG